MAKRIKRTKKAHADLLGNPTLLFGQGPDNPGARVRLWPNGEEEMWIEGRDGQVLSIRASDGPAGLGVTVRALGATGPITAAAYDRDYQTATLTHEARQVTMTVYRADERAQAFKRWYHAEETEADRALLGERYRRTARRIGSN